LRLRADGQAAKLSASDLATVMRTLPIRTRPGRRNGELVVSLPPGWELRLRRIVRELMGDDALPDPRERGLTAVQRQARIHQRQQRMREAMCRFISELITADVIGKEIALATRNRFGRRTGSLREHVAAILREAAGG
jgi:hypothetical protein